MAEEFLDGANVVAGFEQMSGEAVPEGVATDWLCELKPHSRLLMKARQKNSDENHQSQDALLTWESGAVSVRPRKIQTAVFLVFERPRQHVGSHEQHEIDALFGLQTSSILLGPLYVPYFPQ